MEHLTTGGVIYFATHGAYGLLSIPRRPFLPLSTLEHTRVPCPSIAQQVFNKVTTDKHKGHRGSGETQAPISPTSSRPPPGTKQQQASVEPSFGHSPSVVEGNNEDSPKAEAGVPGSAGLQAAGIGDPGGAASAVDLDLLDQEVREVREQCPWNPRF